VEKETQKLIVNNTDIEIIDFDPSKIDLTNIEENSINVIFNGQSINAKILNRDLFNKEYSLEIGNDIFHVKIKNEIEAFLDKMNIENRKPNQLISLKAPMPGLVLDILVSEGDVVKKGDMVIVLEAMKMENSIKIPDNATICKIYVTKGQSIEKGALLIDLKSL
jgi:biotin carboxyl carrier protein